MLGIVYENVQVCLALAPTDVLYPSLLLLLLLLLLMLLLMLLLPLMRMLRMLLSTSEQLESVPGRQAGGGQAAPSSHHDAWSGR